MFLESDKVIKVGHHIRYDYKVLKGMDIVMENVWCTMLGEYILSNGYRRPKGYYSLEKTYERYYNENPYGEQLSLFRPYVPKKTRVEISKKKDDPFSLPEVSYGALDIETAISVYYRQRKELELNDLVDVALFENKYLLALGDMEFRGMPLNIKRWLELAAWSRGKLEPLLSRLQELHPEVENWNALS